MLNPTELLLAIPLLGLLACQGPPAVDVQPDFTATQDLSRVNPRDVAVLPVEDASPGQSAAELLDHMRDEIDRNLVQRRFSPLSHQFVDAALSNVSSAQGSVLEVSHLIRVAGGFDAESAVMALRLNRWDESALLSQSRVSFEAEAVLVGGVSGAILWSGRISGSVKAGGEGPSPLDPGARARSAASIFIEQLLANLPSRQL